jgi:hypothetical protein
MNGLWHMHFTAGPVNGDGVAVWRDGEILGGDHAHTYTGTYQFDGSLLYANVCISPYVSLSTTSDLDRPLTLFLKGSVTGNEGTVSGHPDSQASLNVAVEMHRA